MADHQPDRLLEGSTPSAAKVKADASLRLVTAEGAVVIPVDAEFSDDTPTIISKQQPLLAPPQGAPGDFLTSNLQGKKLAHFELIAPIGVGGMAAVLRARDTQLDRQVALKILPPEMAGDPDNVQRFHQEARAAAKLDHENIARVFFCGEEQNLHFIAFEYVEGENLKSLLEKRGRLPVAEAVRYVLQIATGLEHAAARGVVHRDIKPSNIIISPNGRAKLVDMGLARSREVHKDKGLTQSGVTLGTFDYISPEQALEPRDADARSDIYSLGCTFYHMLTGQAPVPEGTAARKLHHHQHVAPLDPRQLNPEVPDEVALILARMMAKDPRARYQRPVHLVQHLLQVAQKVGAAADVPEGVLFVDTPLPAPPGQRPLLFVSLAVLLLGVVLAVLSLAPPMSVPNTNFKKSSQANVDKKPPLKDTGSTAKSSQPGFSKAITSGAKLKEVLDAPEPSHEISLGGIVAVTGLGITHKVESQRKLIIESKRERDQAIVRFKYDPDRSDDAGLSFEVDGEGSLVLRNLTFEIEAETTPEIIVAAVALRGRGKVKFEKCTFVQKVRLGLPLLTMLDDYHKAAENAKFPLTSVLIDNADGNVKDRPAVVFEECVFKGIATSLTEPAPSGQVAVGVNGPADVTAVNCAFRPHFALFHLRGESGEAGGPKDKDKFELVTLKMDRCSAFVVHGPAFCVDDKAYCRLEVSQSIFSCPERTIRFDPPHLIHQTRATEPIVAFEGTQNRYHNLNALWAYPKAAGGAPHIISDLAEFQANGSKENGSAVLPHSLKLFENANPLTAFSDKDAFVLNPGIRENRVNEQTRKGLGLAQCVWGPMPDLDDLTRLPAVADFKPGPHEKVVDPDNDGTSKSFFKTVQSAIISADPGDVIYIKPGKGGRDVKVESIPLVKPDIDFSLRAYPGTQPRLKLGLTQDQDAALFRLTDGKMVVEDLEFFIEPSADGFKAQAVALITGNGHCTFKNCKVTLKPGNPAIVSKPVPLSMIALADPDEAMKMGTRPSRAAPEVFLHECFVKGDGDLLTIRASRPVYLDINNSLVALAGSLVSIQGATKEPTAEANAEMRIHLERTSAYLTEPLFWLRGNRAGKGLLPLHIESVRESLFAGLGEQPAPMVLFEGTEYDETALRKLFTWKGDDNAYLNHETLLEQRRLDIAPTFRLDQQRWLDLTKEARSKTFRSFALSPLIMPGQLWESTFEAFAPDKQLDRFGHRLNTQAAPKTRLDQ